MKLFKFTSFDSGRRILQDGLIRFSQPPALNDPFDSVPYIAEFFTAEQLNFLLDEVGTDETLTNSVFVKLLTEKYGELPPAFRLQFTLSQWIEYGKVRLAGEVSKAGRPLSELLRDHVLADTEMSRNNLAGQLHEFLGNNLGILSLSGVVSHHLLWAHYADSHRGIAIEFDASNSFFIDVREVIYVSERIGISLSEVMQSEENAKKAALHMVFTKHVDWSYEQEYRLVRPLQIADEIGGTDRFGYPIYLFKFPLSSVKRVLLGSRINSSDIEKIQLILSGDRYRHITVARAIADPTGYRMNIEDKAATI